MRAANVLHFCTIWHQDRIDCNVVDLLSSTRRSNAMPSTRVGAHGATGKGNDQVRFEIMCAQALDAKIRTIAP